MRRQGTTTGRLSDFKHVEATAAAEEKIIPAALPPQSMKRIRGSFDIYALEGKEEYIKLDLWPSLPQDGCSDIEGGDRSMYGAKESHLAAAAAASEISPVLATYDGQSRLLVADQSTQALSEPDNSSVDLSDCNRVEVLDDDGCASAKHERSN
ncbi:hypothetical protein H4R20_004289 [Coemansia guatemalensis]|uniref:Uncharacterized protein n=1 Tax=Coemansia guatemalensis TaxID=2761395 RepID=A0A9W8HRR2_9FUNG|nr:hypothetical protein H4R20_004289 [Coemansia guatemalensis]